MPKKIYEQEFFVLSQLRIQTGKIQLSIKLLLKDKMGGRIKNFNILGVHGKIRVLEGGGSRETNI